MIMSKLQQEDEGETTAVRKKSRCTNTAQVPLNTHPTPTKAAYKPQRGRL